MSLFRLKVYALLRTVPAGRVITYGQLAAWAGRAGAARAVGGYMRHNPDAPHTPCHRVVAADGSLHGYSAAGGLQRKRQLLLAEGVVFHPQQPTRVDLSQSGYQPLDESAAGAGTSAIATWWTYIVACADGSYYTGIARDLDRRLQQHNLGKGAKYTAGRGPVQLRYCEVYGDRAGASRREHQLKLLNRQEKIQIILANRPPCKSAS